LSIHEEVAACHKQQQSGQEQPTCLNKLSDDDESSSKSSSFGSRTLIAKFGILGAVIICNGSPTDLPTNNDSSSLSLTTTKGMYHHQTTLADGRVIEMLVSAWNENKNISKCQWIELGRHPVED
jgi:hypothetical protein